MVDLPQGTSVAKQDLPPGTSPADSPQGEDFGIGKFVDRVVRSVASGVTFGFVDELAAFQQSITGDIDFTTALAQEKAKDVEFEQRFPKTAIAGKVTGAVVSPVSKIAAPIKGAGVLATTLRGAGTGAAAGALAAAGEAEGGLAERGAAAVKGGVIGGATGGVAAPVLQIAGAGLQRLSRIVTGKIGPENEAARKILSALRDDKISAADAVERLRGLGPKGALSDVGEENLRGVARAAAGTPGPARTVAREFLKQRQLEQGGRVTQAARKAFGEFRKFAGTIDDLTEARAAAAAPLYAKAYAKEVPLTPELLRVLNTDAGKKAFTTAKRIASNEGRRLPEVLSIADDGTLKINIEAVPDMRSWDIIKRAFDSVINSRRNQVTGKLDLSDPLTRSINDVRRSLVNELDNLNPDYKAARAVFAGPAQALESMNRGRAFLKGDADDTLKAIKDMTPAEKDFYRLGVVRGIQDVVENTRDVTDVVGRLFGSQRMRNKLQAVFPDQKSFAQFERFMKAEAAMAETRKVVLGGSPTARIQAEQRRLAGLTEGLEDAARGDLTSAVLRTVLSGIRKEVTPEVSEQLGKLLFTGGKVNISNVRKIFTAEPLAGIPENVSAQIRQRLVVAAGATGGRASQ